MFFGFDTLRTLLHKVKSGGVFSSLFLVIKKSYWAIMIPAVSLTYGVYKILDEKGIIDTISGFIMDNINSISVYAHDCASLIDLYDIRPFLNYCILP